MAQAKQADAEIAALLVSYNLTDARLRLLDAERARGAALDLEKNSDAKKKIKEDAELVTAPIAAEIKKFKEVKEGQSASIRERYSAFYTNDAKFLEERWPVIEPALKRHLARQERRVKHWEASCRLATCINPARASRQAKGPRKQRRWTSHFCGLHTGLKNVLTAAQIAELRGNIAKRVSVAA